MGQGGVRIHQTKVSNSSACFMVQEILGGMATAMSSTAPSLADGRVLQHVLMKEPRRHVSLARR